MFAEWRLSVTRTYEYVIFYLGLLDLEMIWLSWTKAAFLMIYVVKNLHPFVHLFVFLDINLNDFIT